MKKEEYLKLILFKHIILSNDEHEIIEVLNRIEDPLCKFIDLITYTYEFDEAFFQLDGSIINKIFTVLNHYRYEDKNKIFNDTINDYITMFNLKSKIEDEDRRILLNKYIYNEAGMRCTSIYNDFMLFYILQNDMPIFQNLYDGNIDETTKFLIEEATYNFLNMCPEIYENQDIVNNTLEVLTNKKPNLNIRENILRKKLINEMNYLKK